MTRPKYHVFQNGLLVQPNDIMTYRDGLSRFRAALEAASIGTVVTLRGFNWRARRLRRSVITAA